MSVLVVRRLSSRSPDAVLALQRHLLGLSARARSTKEPVLVLSTAEAPGALLGRFQSYGPGRTDAPPAGIHRRLSGGRAAAAGPGILWISLVLPQLTELTAPKPVPITPDRALNRYCRGVLRGLASLGIPAFYPGQDSITVRRRPLALLSADVTPTGLALFDCLIGVTAPIAELPDVPHLGGAPAPTALPAQTCTTVAAELGRTITMDEVVAAICQGYEDQSRMELDYRQANPLEDQLLDVICEQDVCVPEWVFGGVGGPEHEYSANVAIQLGRFQVGCALQQRHFLTNVTFAGDFIATGGVVEALEKKLRLCPADWKSIGIATDAVFQEPYRTMLGIGARQTIPNTVMQAVETALPQPANR